jgi:restriction system protein
LSRCWWCRCCKRFARNKKGSLGCLFCCQAWFSTPGLWLEIPDWRGFPVGYIPAPPGLQRGFEFEKEVPVQLKMNKNSLFAILSRSPWWVSFLIAAGLFLAIRQFLPDVAALFSTLPFLGIAAYAGWRQLRTPSADAIAASLDSLRAMGWQEFAAKMEAGFAADGYTVSAVAGDAADYELRKDGRVALLACKRWKVAQAGIGPLRALVEAKEAAGAHECIYVAAGDLSPNASAFAQQAKLRLVSGADLAGLVARGAAARKPAS